ncbi:MAG: LysR family transcriptional regulator [Pseudomonadota bacterium]
MALTFRKLEVFVTVAQDGNFRRAAERLNISQPSVSAQVKSVERYLGYPLFDRRRGATSLLSVEGQAFLERARELVHAQSALAASRPKLSRPPRYHLRITVGPLLLERLIKPVIGKFQARHPQIDLEFVSFNPTLAGSEVLQRGDIDILLFTGGPEPAQEGSNVVTEVLSRVNCSLYGVPALVRPVLRGDVSLADLPYLLLPDHFRFTQWTLEQLARHGIHPTHIMGRPPLMDVLLQMVLAGSGVAMFYDLEVEEHRRAGRVLPFGPRLDPAYRMLMLGPRARTEAAAPVLRFLREVAQPEKIAATQHTPRRRVRAAAAVTETAVLPAIV